MLLNDKHCYMTVPGNNKKFIIGDKFFYVKNVWLQYRFKEVEITKQRPFWSLLG